MNELRQTWGRVRAASWSAWPWRAKLFTVLLAGYLLVTVAVIVPSPLLTLDGWIVGARLHHEPELVRKLNEYVVLGQRKPAIRVFFPFFVWVALRKRSFTPLLLLTLSLLLLNVSVGVVKLATGRIGPRATTDVHDIFQAGGDIYPSGHVSNAVVLFGMMAYLALRFRRSMIAIAAFLSVTIGVATLFIGSHWLSDVIGGWLAGALVLLLVNFFEPAVERSKVRTMAWARSGVARAVAVATVSVFFGGILLSWVYFDIQWSVPLAVTTAIVLVALVTPGFAPPLFRRVFPRRAVPAAARAASAPVEAASAPVEAAPRPARLIVVPRAARAPRGDEDDARREPIGSRS